MTEYTIPVLEVCENVYYTVVLKKEIQDQLDDMQARIIKMQETLEILSKGIV